MRDQMRNQMRERPGGGAGAGVVAGDKHQAISEGPGAAGDCKLCFFWFVISSLYIVIISVCHLYLMLSLCNLIVLYNGH